MGTAVVAEACRRVGVEKVVYASSAAVYGEPKYLPIDEGHPTEPLSPYGLSKLVGELVLRQYA
ncbi:MAG: UDP-glucose 4-epimerase, partial [Desulfurococcales archaeon ex4484_217_2]